MSYTVVNSERYGKKNIMEVNTNQVIHLDKETDDANKLCRKLNLGSGFNGFTPPFMIRNFKNE